MRVVLGCVDERKMRVGSWSVYTGCYSMLLTYCSITFRSLRGQELKKVRVSRSARRAGVDCATAFDAEVDLGDERAPQVYAPRPLLLRP